MLFNKLIKFKFFKFIQSGFYIDFIFKKISEYFLRNFFIYSSTFFGEKFLIEFLTKKIIDKFIYNYSKSNLFNYDESRYFMQLIFFLSLFIFTIVTLLLFL